MRIILNYGYDHQQPLPEAQGSVLALASSGQQAQEAQEARQARRDHTPPTDDEMDVMMLDGQWEEKKSEPHPDPDSDQNSEVNDVDVDVTVVPAITAKEEFERNEEKNAKREKQDQDMISASVMSSSGNKSFSMGNHAQQDYEMQLMILEQQNKRRLMLAREEQKSCHDAAQDSAVVDAISAPPASPIGPREKTTTWGKQDQDVIYAPAISSLNEQSLPIGYQAQQDFQMQLMILEQQNKKRMYTTRQEHISRRDADQKPSMIDAAAPVASAATEGPLIVNTTMGKQDRGVIPAPAIFSPAKPFSIDNHTSSDYQTQLINMEQVSKKPLEKETQEQKSRR